jgi:hypothetical protein
LTWRIHQSPNTPTRTRKVKIPLQLSILQEPELISPKNSKSSNLFVKNKKKSTALRDLGLEYDKDVTNDEEYYEKIFKTNAYRASQEDLIDIYEDITRIMVIFYTILTSQGWLLHQRQEKRRSDARDDSP